MIISAVTVAYLDVPMHHPIKTPIGVIDAACNVVVKIETHSGLVGWGETSPMSPITGETQRSVHAHAMDLAKLLIGKDACSLQQNLTQLRLFSGRSSGALNALDMALHDLAAQHAGLPLYQFLGGSRRDLETDHTIGHQRSVADSVAMAQQLVGDGFRTLKLKTGRKDFADIEHVAAIRAALGSSIKLRIDCNQGWDFPEAVANARQLEKFAIEYLEQPLPAWDIDGFARLRKTINIPICADESLFNHHDALLLVKADAVDFMNIKLVKSGGIDTALKINSIAEAAGIRCMIGCFGESRLGLTAAAHLAVARPNIHFIDLDSSLHFVSDPVDGGIQIVANAAGKIILPNGPGLDARFNESVLTNQQCIA